MLLEGECAPRFAAVRDAFARNLANGELGACVAAYQDGRKVLDVWGGHRDLAGTRPWTRDTIVLTMSVTKSIAALCVLVLADRGRIDLAAPVARYWPEFGKPAITVELVLAQLASLPYCDAPPGSLWQPGSVAAALERREPEWPPGSTPCYHSFTAGPLYGEIVRRVDGRSLGRFLQEEIATPLGADFFIGLDAAADARRAQYQTTPGTPSWDGIKRRAPSPLNRAWLALPDDEDCNSENWRFREFPSANGHGSAAGVARIFAALACGGELDGVRVISRDLLEHAAKARWHGVEAMTRREFRYGLGFMLSCPPAPMGGRADTFGHMGIGGAVGFADPKARLSFSYLPNRMAPVADQGPYAAALIDAFYRSLDS